MPLVGACSTNAWVCYSLVHFQEEAVPVMEQGIRRRYGTSGQVPQKEAVGEEDMLCKGRTESVMVEIGEAGGRGSRRYGSA